jgi:hypothetical protein
MKETPMKILAACLFVAGCTDAAMTPPSLLDPPPDGQGFQLQMTSTIAAGTEAQHCMFQTVPDSYINHDQVRFTQGSHHLLVFQTSYASIPTQKDDGTPVDTSGVFDCSDGPTNGWSVTKLIAGSQNGDGESMLSFPDGIGVHVGGVVLINIHYINASDTDLNPEARINFFTTPTLTTEGDVLFLYNPLIAVPAGQTSKAEWKCPVYSDITIANVQSHMHARGVGYSAGIDDQTPFYVNDQWEAVPVQHYDSLTVKVGQTLHYHCDYRNTESRNIFQGPRTTDEMCMLIGSYYPADARTANCLTPDGKLPGGDWIGNGTATCAATMGCLQTAGSDFHALTACMLAASPAVSHTSSELVRCLFASSDPATQCSAQISACSAQ